MATPSSSIYKVKSKEWEILGEKTLSTLDLSRKNLKRLPDEVFELNDLEALDLSWNNNIELSNELIKLTNLKLLSLDMCNLATVPAVVMELPQLQTLILSNNWNITLPDEMAGLVNLTTLVLDSCNMMSVPAVVMKLTQLKALVLSYNKNITLPDEMASLVNLTTLNLTTCKLDSLPPAVLKQLRLHTLDLSLNKQISLPDELYRLGNVKVLRLRECSMETVPPAVLKLTQLEELDLSENSGIHLPDGMSGLTNIRVLHLIKTDMVTVPPVVWRLTRLERLDLSDSPLQTLPAEIGQLTNVKQLDLLFCKLHTLPPEVGRLTQLEWLNLRHNSLQTLPAEVGQLTKVKHLDLSHCQLHTLPPEVWRLIRLEWLNLSWNPLHTLPAEVGQLTNVKHLGLSNCQLHTLPPEVGSLTQLKWLDLSSNTLQTLPAEIGQLTKVKHLDLSHCQLYTLPPEVGKLARLEWLDLSFNPLQMLPAEVGQLTNVKHLDLSHCQLRTLPPEVGRLAELEELNLSFNTLQTLPAEFGQLSSVRLLITKENPFKRPPPEVCFEGITAIRQYFDELERSEGKVSARLKVVVLGETMAGKTSLVHTLQRGETTLTEEEDRTHCVEITQWTPGDNIAFKVYDFGGHDVYHLTHQFFLTRDALNLLTVNLQTYNCTEQRYTEAVGFWLDTLNARVSEAVVTIVGSKTDMCSDTEIEDKTRDIIERFDQQFNIWQRTIQQQIKELDNSKVAEGGTDQREVRQQLERTRQLLTHPLRLTGVCSVSLKGRTSGLDRLRSHILNTANDTALFPSLRRILPRTWMEFEQQFHDNGTEKRQKKSRQVKEKFFGDKKPKCMTWDECLQRGQLVGLNAYRLEPVLSYLQQVGTILRYPDIPELKYLVFHDPPALIEIFKDLFHHDIKALFATDRLQDANYTNLQLVGFEQDLRDCGLIQKDVLACMLPSTVDTDIVTALMQHFGLCFELKADDKAEPSKRTIMYKIPWYLYKQMPEELMSVWPEDVPKKQEQLQLMCDIRGFRPRGLFQRFSVGIHPLVKDRTDWKDGVMAYRQDYPVLVYSKPAADDTYITIATRGRPDQACELWGVVHPLLEVLVQLLQEWPGVLYSLHVTCAHCIKARLDNPHQYDLRDRTDDDGCDVWCPRVKKTASTSADLVCRPSRFTVGEHRSSLTTRRLLKKGNDYYKMTSDPRGLALIISNINFKKRTTRHGGEKDLDTLRKICAKLKLQPEIKNDLTKQGIEAVTMEVSMRDHSSYDCFVLFLLSHGGETGVLGTDGQHVSVDSIVSSFQACQSPVGKPKIFFIQACRGVDRDPGQEHTDTTGTLDEGRSTQQAGRGASDGATEPTKSPPPPTSAPAASAASLESPDAGERTLPTASDRLVMYATVHGHVSWRNSDTGTWLVQVLADVITEHAETETLLEMLTRVNAKVADFKTQHQEYKQQPEVTHTLRKKLYFFPQAAVDQNP